jgi:hypothetical protein
VQKSTDLRASVLLSLAANTSLLSGTSRVIFLVRSREHQGQDRCLRRMLRRRPFTTTVWVPGISCPLGVSVRRCSCAKFALHSASKVIGLRMKSAWSYGEFEAVTDVTLEGQSLVSLPSASTSGSNPWSKGDFPCNMRARGTDTYLDDFRVSQDLRPKFYH